jgi:hypothetical protein
MKLHKVTPQLVFRCCAATKLAHLNSIETNKFRHENMHTNRCQCLCFPFCVLGLDFCGCKGIYFLTPNVRQKSDEAAIVLNVVHY